MCPPGLRTQAGEGPSHLLGMPEGWREAGGMNVTDAIVKLFAQQLWRLEDVVEEWAAHFESQRSQEEEG